MNIATSEETAALVLNRLRQPLPTLEGPGLDAADPRILHLADLHAQKRLDELRDALSQLASEGICDIRAAVYELLLAFDEGGLALLGEIIGTVSALVSNRDGVGPGKRKNQVFDKRLSWLFETILHAIKYEEAKKTARFRHWAESVDVACLGQTVERAFALGDLVDGIPLATTTRTLSELREWLRRHLEGVDVQMTAEAHQQSEKLDQSPPLSEVALPPGYLRVELMASPRFFELLAKLDAFVKLIRKGNHVKAAVVSDDILAMIRQFDPLEYFPQTFAEFSALLSANITVLAPHWDMRDTSAWEALARHCRVDLGGFVGD